MVITTLSLVSIAGSSSAEWIQHSVLDDLSGFHPDVRTVPVTNLHFLTDFERTDARQFSNRQERMRV